LEECLLSRSATLRRAHPGEAEAVASVLAEAFYNDPTGIWVWPDADTRLAAGKDVFGVFASALLEAGEGYFGDSDGGVALWLPVGPDDEPSDGSFEAAVAEASGPYAERAAVLMEMMAAAHPVHTQHLHLPLLGVRPSMQGKGIGSSLLKARLDDLDREGIPAYLEATSVDNARLYARHGFKHMDTDIHLPDGPTLYRMWREPQGA